MKAVRPSCGRVLCVLIASGALLGGAVARGGEPDTSTSELAEAAVVKIDLSELRDRAEAMPIDKRTDIDKRIAATVARVNNAATEKGQTAFAARLASEFGMTTEALLDQKGEHGLSWGEFMIAHTLLANSDAGVTLPDLMTLRSEGLGWGALAYGLQFHLEDFEETIKAQGRIAMGLSKADGKSPEIGK